MNVQVSEFITKLAAITADYQIAILLWVFAIALIAKFLTYFVIRSQLGWVRAFDLRVHRHMEGWYDETRPNQLGFHGLVRHVLSRAFHEYYVMRHAGARRRKEDPFMHIINKIFLFETAGEQMVTDTLRQTRMMKKYVERPQLENVTNFALTNNHYFNRALAFMPIASLNRVFAVLPSIFIITGILGTFLGITQGLPVLEQIDPKNPDQAQGVIQSFLSHVTFAMMSSVMGILLSIAFTIVNAVFATNSTQRQIFDLYNQCLDTLWHSASSGEAIVEDKDDTPRRYFEDDEQKVAKRGEPGEPAEMGPVQVPG